MTETVFFIKGMHCQSCATLIEGELIDLPGVKSAKVDYKLGRATVTYDESLVNESDLILAVEKLGGYRTEGIKKLR